MERQPVAVAFVGIDFPKRAPRVATDTMMPTGTKATRMFGPPAPAGG